MCLSRIVQMIITSGTKLTHVNVSDTTVYRIPPENIWVIVKNTITKNKAKP